MTKKVVISFPDGEASRPLIYELIKKYDIMVSIIKADIDGGRSGKLVLELDSDSEHIAQAIDFMQKSGVDVSPLEKQISSDGSVCVSCRACTSACPSGASSIGAPGWKLRFQPDKCVVCKMCITACPLKLFKIEFAD